MLQPYSAIYSSEFQEPAVTTSLEHGRADLLPTDCSPCHRCTIVTPGFEDGAHLPHGSDCSECATYGVTHAACADPVNDLQRVGAVHHGAADEVSHSGARLIDGHAVQVDQRA